MSGGKLERNLSTPAHRRWWAAVDEAAARGREIEQSLMGVPVSEYNFRQQVVKELQRLGTDPISVENRVRAGTPDVECTLGWLELKYLPEWPKLPETPVRIDHFTNQQRNFLRRRWKAGGGAWLLLRVGSRGVIENLLFQGPDAADFVGYLDRAKLESLATLHSYGRITGEDLREKLVR